MLFSRLRLALALSLVASATSYAQRGRQATGGAGYEDGLGLRAGGYSSGATFKHFLAGRNNVAFEGLLTTDYRARGARLTLLLEKHRPVSDLRGLQFFYGAGGHLGAYRGRYYFNDIRFRRGRSYYYYRSYTNEALRVAGGADLILGLEYKMEDLPFVLGVDYKPFFEVFRGYAGFYHDAAVSLRYTF